MRKENDPSVFLLTLGGSRLLHAPLHGASVLLDLEGPLPQSAISTWCASTPEQKKGDFIPDFIGLIPTRGCNLDCRYCGFRRLDAPSEIMPLEIAEAGIEWYANLLKRTGKEILNIHFFGGEPFSQPKFCMGAVQAARRIARMHGMGTVFEAATNGFMNEDTTKFVRDSIDCIVLSLDGPPEIQNRHRPRRNGAGSFNQVCRSASIFSEAPGKLCLRACITSETVHRMEEIATWFCTEFRPAAVSFETLQESSESMDAGLKAPDPWDFALHFVKAESLLECAGVKAVYATADTSTCKISFCPVARDVAILSPDGRISGCYLLDKDWESRGMDLHLGRVLPSGKVLIYKNAIQRLRSLNVINKPRCENCFCKWHCAGGCHVNHTFPGCNNRFDDLCIQTRIIALLHILKSLGREDVFDRLTGDQEALQRVILQSSDRLDSNVLERVQ